MRCSIALYSTTGNLSSFGGGPGTGGPLLWHYDAIECSGALLTQTKNYWCIWMLWLCPWMLRTALTRSRYVDWHFWNIFRLVHGSNRLQTETGPFKNRMVGSVLHSSNLTELDLQSGSWFSLKVEKTGLNWTLTPLTTMYRALHLHDFLSKHKLKSLVLAFIGHQ